MFSQCKSIVFLLTYIFLIYVRPQEFIVELRGEPILPIVLILAAVSWVRESSKDMHAPQFKLMGWLYFLMCWSLLKGGLLEEAFATFGGFFPVVLLFFLVASSINTLQRLRALFVVIGIAMTIIAIHSIDEAAKGIGWTGAIPIKGRVTYVGFLSDPNDLSMAMLMAMPLMVYTAYRANWFMRIVWSAALLALMYAVTLCDSRGAMLSLAMILMHFSVLRFGVKRSLVVAPLLLIPIVLLGSSRMGDMSAKEESAEGRVMAWQQGFLMFFSNPLFGVGAGQFTSYHYLTAHNSYMLALAELGFFGFMVWLSNLALSVLMCVSVEFQRESTPPPPSTALPPDDWDEVRLCSRVLWLGLTGGLSAMFFLSRSYNMIIYLHMAMVVAVWQIARRSNSLMPVMSWSTHGKKMAMLSLGGVIFLYLVTLKLNS